MSDTTTSPRSMGIGRIGNRAAWASAACCLPYLILKLLWTAGVPWGVSDRSLLDRPAWMAQNAFTAVLELVGVGLVVVITRPRALRLPAWLLLFPSWMGIGLLFPLLAGSVLLAVNRSSGSDPGTHLGGIRPWVFVMVYTGFSGQGAALAVAFWSYVRARWGRLLRLRTGDVLNGLRPRRRAAVTGTAVVAAALAVAVTGVLGYWAAGGNGRPDLPGEILVGRAIGSLLAVAGALALVTRWGRRRRLWLPATLGWLGSGCLTADSSMFLVLNRVWPGVSLPPWNVLDTLRAAEGVAGVLALAAGALLVVARETLHGDLPGPGGTIRRR